MSKNETDLDNIPYAEEISVYTQSSTNIRMIPNSVKESHDTFSFSCEDLISEIVIKGDGLILNINEDR